jgi:hypothetical protein
MILLQLPQRLVAMPSSRDAAVFAVIMAVLVGAILVGALLARRNRPKTDNGRASKLPKPIGS